MRAMTTKQPKIPRCFTLDKDVSDAITDRANRLRQPDEKYKQRDTGAAGLVNFILAKELLGQEHCQANHLWDDKREATPRERVDFAVQQLRQGLDDLMGACGLTDADIELCVPVSKHPASKGTQ